jgi:hypothetical protein
MYIFTSIYVQKLIKYKRLIISNNNITKDIFIFFAALHSKYISFQKCLGS